MSTYPKILIMSWSNSVKIVIFVNCSVYTICIFLLTLFPIFLRTPGKRKMEHSHNLRNFFRSSVSLMICLSILAYLANSSCIEMVRNSDLNSKIFWAKSLSAGSTLTAKLANWKWLNVWHVSKLCLVMWQCSSSLSAFKDPEIIA